MADIDLTTCVAIDEQHAKELLYALPTWITFRPEIFLHPFVLLADAAMPGALANMVVDKLKHPNITVVGVDNKEPTQRGKMLGALVMEAPRHVKTKWMLKLDTDAIARSWDRRWCDESIVAGDPAFVASPWNYSKPPDVVQWLDNWGDVTPEIAKGGRLDLPVTPGSNIVSTPGRIISYVFFGRTDWLRWAASVAKLGMPVPSQDTYHWYVAKRSGTPFKTHSMKQYGWDHVRGRRVAEEVSRIQLCPEIKEMPYRRSIASLLEHFTDICQCDGRKCRMAEIGVARGETSSWLLQRFPNLSMTLVDPWDTYGKDSAYRQSGDREARMDADGKRESCLTTIRNVGFAWDRVDLMRMTSVKAATMVDDESLEMVFVDASHVYEDVVADLAAWYPKVKKGGILSGHDFGHRRYPVGKAVREFAVAKNLELKLHPGTVFSMRKP